MATRRKSTETEPVKVERELPHVDSIPLDKAREILEEFLEERFVDRAISEIVTAQQQESDKREFLLRVIRAIMTYIPQAASLL